MTEYIFKPRCTDDFELDERDKTTPVDWYGTLHGEIVRCRDCKYWRTWDCSSIYGNHERDRHACFRFVDGWRMETDSTDFCSFGVRKEGGDGDTRSDITNTRFCS